MTTSAEHEASFAETALRLSGKEEEEVRRTGTLDRADEQVEAMFQPQYRTENSPLHRAIWDGAGALDDFDPPPLPASAPCDRAMEASLEVVRQRQTAGTLHDAQGKIHPDVLAE